MGTNIDLQELLDRAVELEGKSGTLDDETFVSESLSLSREAAGAMLSEVKAQVQAMSEVAETLLSLSVGAEQVKAGAAAAPAPAPAAPAPAGGWEPCPECGSTDVEEFADGTATCVDCGSPLARAGQQAAAAPAPTPAPAGGQAKGYDFDADEDGEFVGDFEAKTDGDETVETKSDDHVDLADLLARRAALTDD